MQEVFDMARPRPVLLLALPVAIAACTGPATPPTGTAGASAGAPRTIEVKMTDALRFEPSEITVTAGETVTFAAFNGGKIVHELYVGDQAAQAAHETEMTQMGGMRTDEPAGIFVDPGQRKTLRFTFATAGTLLIGCHELGHYAGGMKGTVTVK